MNLNFFKNNKSTVQINGISYTGKNVTINGDKVVVDGVIQTQSLAGPITVTVQGSCDSVSTASGDIYINGNSGRVTATSGDIDVIGNVEGSIQTVSGDVNVRRTHTNNISTVSGDIRVYKG